MFVSPDITYRNLTDPAGKIYSATMEEGLYEVDVKTLAVTELWADEQKKEAASPLDVVRRSSSR